MAKTSKKLPYNYEKKIHGGKRGAHNITRVGQGWGYGKYTTLTPSNYTSVKRVGLRGFFFIYWHDFGDKRKRKMKKIFLHRITPKWLKRSHWRLNRVYFHFRSFMKLCFIRWWLFEMRWSLKCGADEMEIMELFGLLVNLLLIVYWQWGFSVRNIQYYLEEWNSERCMCFDYKIRTLLL